MAHAIVDVVCFDESLYGISVQSEIGGLSKAFFKAAIEHFIKLKGRQIDPFQLQEWRTYAGLPVIMIPWGDELMIYAVQSLLERGERMIKINVMFAGARSQGYAGIDGVWDGSDASLWTVIETRCRLKFK